MPDNISKTIRMPFLIVICIFMAPALILIANSLSFIQDDAYISFRYAENLISGYGLVWEPGEYVQGYTNFLWVILLSAASYLSFSMDEGAQFLGIAHFVAACFVFFFICIRVFQSFWIAIAAFIVLSTNFSFASYATGGLETMQQALLILCLLYSYLMLLEKPESRKAALIFSIVSGLLMLCRLDSALFIFCVGLGALFALRRSGVTQYIVLLVPGSIILGSFLLFCYLYYGSIFPNTFHVKAGGATIASLKLGANYVAGFLVFYSLAIPLAFGLVSSIRSGMRFVFIPIASYSVLWMIYVVSVGGDFMEFRMMVPALPIFLLLIVNALTFLKTEHQRIAAIICVPVIVFASAAYYFGDWKLKGVERIEVLQGHLTGRTEDWIGVGRRLGEVFPGGYSDGPSIAVTAAGAVPFYSRLRTVDMLGLNDVEIARNGIKSSDRAGHRQGAEPSLLVERRVNLVIGHPFMIPEADIEEVEICADRFLFLLNSGGVAPEEFFQYPILATKVNDGFYVAMLYLTEHPSVEASLASNAMIRIRERSDAGCEA